MGTNSNGDRKRALEELGLEVLYVQIPGDIKQRASEEAYHSHLPMNEYIARILAERFGMPQPVIPRDYRRKPKKNGTNGHSGNGQKKPRK